MHTETDLETMLLGPVLADRACGDCAACCTVLTVDTPDFKKPAGTPCTHLQFAGMRHPCGAPAYLPDMVLRLAAGRGHARRSPAGPVRPARVAQFRARAAATASKASRSTSARSPAVTRSRMAWPRPFSTACAISWSPVWFSDGSKKMLMHPENEVASPRPLGRNRARHLQDEVAAWRERYGVFAANGRGLILRSREAEGAAQPDQRCFLVVVAVKSGSFFATQSTNLRTLGVGQQALHIHARAVAVRNW